MKDRPKCFKCGGQHWRFVACADADAANAREAEVAVEKAAQQARSVVQPLYRDRSGGLALGRTAFSTEYDTSGMARRITRNTNPPEAA